MSDVKWVFDPSTDPLVEDDSWVLSGTVYYIQVVGPNEYIVKEFHEDEGWGRDHGVFKTLKKAMTRAEELAGRTRWDSSMNGRPAPDTTVKRFLIVSGEGYYHDENFDDGKLGIRIVEEDYFEGREDEVKDVLALRVGESAVTEHPISFETIVRLPDREGVK